MNYKEKLNELPFTSTTVFGFKFPKYAMLHVLILFLIAVAIDSWQYLHAYSFEKEKIIINHELVNNWLSFPIILIASFVADKEWTRRKILLVVKIVEKEFLKKGIPLSEDQKIDGFYHVYRKAISPSLLSFLTGFMIYLVIMFLHTIVSLSITMLILHK